MADQVSGVLLCAGKAGAAPRGRRHMRGGRREMRRPGGGTLRDPRRSFQPQPGDVRVGADLVRDFELITGAVVRGPWRDTPHGPELAKVESVCGLAPEEYRARPRFADLVAINPQQRFELGASGDLSARIIDLIAPIGKGTRGLIVSPAKAGKTTLLEKIAHGMLAANPETRIIVLLVDERPEEVTHFRRSVGAEVLASTNDQSFAQHIELAEITLAHVQVELECGHDVVVMVDSLTRMGRAFNLKGSGTRRTMSGGLEAGALDMPRRFFGLARNVENGGSVTIIATALVDTGSRMDQIIFEEFKGTGNSEIVLDREMAQERIFPAINIVASGTRREEQLYGEDDVRRLATLRRFLVRQKLAPAMRKLIKVLEEYPTNAEVLRNLAAG